MKESNAFYEQRDKRTSQYAGASSFNRFPVHISIDIPYSVSPAGQLALLSLVNQVIRVHRVVTVSLPAMEIRLAANVPFYNGTLKDMLVTSANKIDPYGSFNLTRTKPTGAISLGIGNPDSSCDWYLGIENSIAILDRKPTGFDLKSPGSLRGAALTSCIGAATIFKCQLGIQQYPIRISAWNFLEGDNAEAGPLALEPVNVGNVLVVGAGAVGSAFVYWLYSFGLGDGNWTILDKDTVAVHNTNRSLLFTPGQAGWFGGDPSYKADICASLLPNSKSVTNWYHEYSPNEKFDVILALANEYDIRTRIANLNASVVLHATTGEGWLSELHRHILGRDDCIQCRMRDFQPPRFGCSSATVTDERTQRSSDAALPFLSAASGLMLAVALEKLQRNELQQGNVNNWKFYFKSDYRITQQTINECRAGCSLIHPGVIRRKLNMGTRWADLDPG